MAWKGVVIFCRARVGGGLSPRHDGEVEPLARLSQGSAKTYSRHDGEVETLARPWQDLGKRQAHVSPCLPAIMARIPKLPRVGSFGQHAATARRQGETMADSETPCLRKSPRQNGEVAIFRNNFRKINRFFLRSYNLGRAVCKEKKTNGSLKLPGHVAESIV